MDQNDDYTKVQLKEISIEDLLPRDQIHVRYGFYWKFIARKENYDNEGLLVVSVQRWFDRLLFIILQN